MFSEGTRYRFVEGARYIFTEGTSYINCSQLMSNYFQVNQP